MSNKATGQHRPLEMNIAVTLSALVHPEPEAGGFSAEIPALPGCYTQGESLPEVEANLREAAEAWLAAAHEDAASQQSSCLQTRWLGAQSGRAGAWQHRP